jgi:hypothetical protein
VRCVGQFANAGFGWGPTEVFGSRKRASVVSNEAQCIADGNK